MSGEGIRRRRGKSAADSPVRWWRISFVRAGYFSAPSVSATPFLDSLRGESPSASLTPDLIRVVSPGPWKKA